jgi:NADH oxidase (H2O2-forming)
MKQADLVIVGGSAAGIEAAIVAQRHYELDKVVVIRKEDSVMVPCGIPYIFGTLGSIDKNVMPDSLLGDAELIKDEVTSIDRSSQTVTTAGGEAVKYKRLMLASGSQPLRPPIPGMQLENVFAIPKEAEYLRQVQDGLSASSNLVIIGGGFIGVEFADECRKLGINVTVVEMLDHCLMLALDEQFCCTAEDNLRESGVNIITGNGVRALHGQSRVEWVELQDGTRLEADAVIVAIGVSPCTKLALDAGLEIGAQRGIQVDAYMRTSDSQIFAAGDCAETFCYFTRKAVPLRLAAIATREARLATMNLFEDVAPNQGAVGVFSTVVGDTGFCAAGLTEKRARDVGLDVMTAEAAGPDRHPGTMPGASGQKTKLVFERGTGKMLGGQASGGTSTGEIANVMAALISAGSTARDVATFQIGTHPALTASPIAYQIVNAAEHALVRGR